MSKRSRAIIIAAIAVVVVAGAWLLLRRHGSDSAAVHYVARPVGYADISATVSETGTVNPVTQVDVGSQVSGTIQTLYVDFNSIVRKGQVLARLDPTTFQSAVDSARANLSLEEATLNSAQVNVGKMKDLLDLANLTLQQDEPLARQGLINEQQIESERTAALTAEQDYLSAQSAVKVAEAQVEVARGQLEQAQYNLSQTVIRSPFDGIIMARNISVGQTVASSLQTPTLFTLATNLTDMQVDTSVDEADVGSVQTGEAAQLTVTAYPNMPFAGTVSQVRVNPTTVQNVVTYDAVVAVHDSSGRLFPGMTAQVNIEVGKRSHVLTVPIAAVLYRPLAAQPAAQTTAFGGFGAGIVQSSTGSTGGQAVAGAPGSQVTLWLLRSGHPVPVQVVIGLSDGKNIEITSGGLVEGDQVIVAQYRGPARGSTGRPSAPGGTPSAPPAPSTPSTQTTQASPSARMAPATQTTQASPSAPTMRTAQPTGAAGGAAPAGHTRKNRAAPPGAGAPSAAGTTNGPGTSLAPPANAAAPTQQQEVQQP
jgi:HlyD family secretion protein